MKGVGVRIVDLQTGMEDVLYRTPIKFGGTQVDRCTLLNVEVTVSDGARLARGFGSMPLGNVWSFPSRVLSYDQTLGAMKTLAERASWIAIACTESAHPIELNRLLEPEILKAAGALSSELGLAQPIPKLCALVVASPFDAAIHDAYGKLFGLSSYRTCGPGFLEHDLSRYLGPDFRGERLDRYVLPQAKPRMPMYHLVGAVDPITPADVRTPVGDGLPESLDAWVRHNGLTHVKIKLNGEDLSWDVERVLAVERAVAEVQAGRGAADWFTSLDFNEKCANVGYLLGFLAQVREESPAAFKRIRYIEQPTARDLNGNRQNVMHEASKLRPVVIDESLTDLESLVLAREMGYSGAALKACKGQSQALLMAAAAQKYGMFLCVQDLTCPGASLIQSAGIAAHVPGVAGIEANSRQYCPAANRDWEARFPGIFVVKDGTMDTSCLDGPGLGAVPP
jgi:L-alanine-DL-glutamate epimerase-like enolase superfamily enzyme